MNARKATVRLYSITFTVIVVEKTQQSDEGSKGNCKSTIGDRDRDRGTNQRLITKRRP